MREQVTIVKEEKETWHHEDYIEAAATSNTPTRITIDEAIILKLAKRRAFKKLFKLLLRTLALHGDIVRKASAKPSTLKNDRNLIGKGTELVPLDESETYSQISHSNYDSNNNNVTLSTILHDVLMYQPPFSVVDLLCSLLTKDNNYPEAQNDIKGQKPLHVAVIHDCDINVIQRLMISTITRRRREESPALSVDYIGRTPLHWACAGDSSKHNKVLRSLLPKTKAATEKERKIHIIVELLSKQFPEAIQKRDFNGMTPLQLARQQNKVDPRIVEILMKYE